MTATTIRARQMSPVAGMTDGYCWWEIITPTGSAYETAYSAEQAIARYESRHREARCAECDDPLGGDRMHWYGRDYCGDGCLRVAQREQHEATRLDRFWAASGAARMGLWP